MNNQEKTTNFFKSQCINYPLLKPLDLLKGLHQSLFGCGHFITDKALAYLYEELNTMTETAGPDIEILDGDFCRVHLRYLKKYNMAPETLFRLFAKSSKMPCPDAGLLEEKLTLLLELAKNKELPFSYEEIKDEINVWRQNGFCACRHSSEFREAYAPAYRVIHKDFIRWLPLLSAVDRICTSSNHVLVAIEGGSASGKTTLSDFLSEIYDCNVFHMDDFFLRPEQKTKERLAEPGGNIDRERFMAEILQPLSKGETVYYKRFDCMTKQLLEPVKITPKKLNIIEGAYSMHPSLSNYYDLSMFLNIGKDFQKERIRIRNDKDMQERFFSTWIPMEEKYFSTFDIQKRCDIILEVN